MAQRNRVYERILPSVEVLVARLKADPELTFTALAAEYGVSRQAVRKALNKAHIELDRPRIHSLRAHMPPWRVKVEHEQHLHIRMLRLYAREQLGLDIPKDRRTMYRNWRKDMNELDLVVTYNREDGFGVDSRRPGDERYWRP